MAATGIGGGAPPFSIRAFAARARAGAADEGDRCWPLGGAAGPLPPIEVRRFRWWADEAALARELVAEQEDEERRKAAMSRKRSVVELFAAVPRVNGGGEERRVRRKLDKGKLVAGVSAKKGLKKDKAPAEIAAKKKEKSGNAKAASLSISQLFQDAIQKRKLKKYSSKKSKNQEVSVLLSKKNIKGNKKSVLSSQKVITSSSEVQTILKKGEGLFLKNNSDATCLSKSSLKSKHVTFSDADGMCELIASHPKDTTEQSQVVQASQQPSVQDSSQVVDDQRNTEEPHLVYQQIGAISETVDEDSSSLSEKVGSTGASHTVPLTNSKEKTILCNSMDLNHRIAISKRGNGNRPSSMSSAALPSQGLAQKFVDVDFPWQEGLHLGIGRQAGQMPPQGSSAPAGLALDTRPGNRNLMRIPLPPLSSSCYVASLQASSDRNRSTVHQERLTANFHMAEVHPSVLRSGNDVVSSVNTSTGSNRSADAQTTDSGSACRNMPFIGGYNGVPLNSRAQFFRVEPGGGTLNPDEQLKRQCSGKDSLHRSASPAFVAPNTRLDYSHLGFNNQGQVQAPPFFTVANFGIQPDPYLNNPKAPTAYSMDFRQCPPSSERMEVHSYAVASSKYTCSNQQGCPHPCSCAQCLGHNNQLQKSFEMFPRENYEQNVEPAVDTTMRLMGRTVSFGTGSDKRGGLDNWGPCSSPQIRAEGHYFPGTHTQAFPQMFQGGLVVPPSRFGVSNGGRPPSGYASSFSSVPAAEQGSGFSNSNHGQRPQLAVPNKVSSVQPVSRYNGAGLGHQRPAVANQLAVPNSNHSQQPQLAVPNKASPVRPVGRYNGVGRGHQRPAVGNQGQRVESNGHQRLAVANKLQRGQSTAANYLQPGAVDRRRSPRAAAMSYYDPWNKFKNFVETTPRAPFQPRFFPPNSSNMAQRAPMPPPIMSGGYSVQGSPALTGPTKFTSLRPLPPSMVSSHVAQPHGSPQFQPHGSTPFHPPAPLSSQPGKVNAPPGGAIFEEKRSMKQAPTGSNLESSKQMDTSFNPFHPPDPLSSQPGNVNAPGVVSIFEEKRSMKQAPVGSNLESLKQLDTSFRRPAGKDNVVLALPKNQNLSSPLPGKGLESCGSRAYAGQPRNLPVRLSGEPVKNLRVENNDTPPRTVWAEPVHSVGARPVKLQSGATHILEPCASASMDRQEDSWPAHSVVQFEAERTVVGSSKNTDQC